MGELGRDWLRGVGVTVPVTGVGGTFYLLPHPQLLFPSQPYLEHSDTLCSCEAYGMKPTYV
jgi:hypothetical protein